MNKVNKYFIFLSILLCFLLCGCFGAKGYTMTPEEICDYMNENFKGDFELIDKKIEDDDWGDISIAYLKCTLFPEETVVAEQGYYWGGDGGWWEIKRTNYYYFVYKNEIKEKVAGYVQDWFEEFDYKIVNATDEERVMCDMKKFNSLNAFLSAPIKIRYNVVIDTHDGETKTAVATKAEAARKNNKVENSLSIRVFLYEDENFVTLTDEEIKSMDTFDGSYFL